MTINALEHWNRLAANLIEQIGRPGFNTAFTAALRHLLPVETLLATAYFKDSPPVVLFHQVRPDMVDLCVNTYVRGPYRLDPFFQAFMNGATEGIYRLRDLAPDNFYRSAYFRTFYSAVNVKDELALLVHQSDEQCLMISLARRMDDPSYTAAHRKRLRAAFPLLAAAARRHWPQGTGYGDNAIKNSTPAKASALRLTPHLARFGEGILSERESEVARLILMGHSTLSISHNLNISESTVKVHRKHIHAKMGITSQAELFARFMQTLTQML